MARRKKKRKVKPGKQPWFMRPMTGKNLRREMRAAESLQFSGKQKQIEGQQRASDQRVRDLGDWFGDYQRTLQNAQTSTATGYGDAERRIAERASAARSADDAMSQQAMAQAQADAAARGVNFDPSAYQRGQQATSYRQSADNNMADLAALQGANQGAFLSDKQRIGQGELTNQRLQEQARRRGFDADLRGLEDERAAFRLDYRSRLRDSERGFANQQAQLALERASLGSKADYADAMRDVARMGQNKTVNVNNTYSGGGGGKKDFQRGDVREAVGLIRRKATKKQKRTLSNRQLIDILVSDYGNRGISAAEARRAVRIWRRQTKNRGRRR